MFIEIFLKFYLALTNHVITRIKIIINCGEWVMKENPEE